MSWSWSGSLGALSAWWARFARRPEDSSAARHQAAAAAARERSLRHASGEALYRSFFDHVPVGIFVTDPMGNGLFVNRHWCALTGMDPHEVQGAGWTRILHPEDAEEASRKWFAATSSGQDFHAEYRFKTLDGRVIWVSATAAPLRDASGVISGYIGCNSDITARKLFEQRLEQRSREIVLLSELGDLLHSCGSLTEAFEVISRQCRKLFPECAGGLYLTTPSRDDLAAAASWSAGPIAPDTEPWRPEDCWALRRGREHLVEDPDTDLPCRHPRFAGAVTSLCVPMLALGETLGIFHLASDAGPLGVRSEGVRRLASAVAEHLGMAIANLNLRETLHQQSIRDPLTGLFNRRYFEESLEREVRRARRHESSFGVILLDLDHFKRFNDTFGHEAGDVMLRTFGEFLRTRVRGEDVACRLGGEEFALLLPDAALENVHRRAEELRLEAHALQVSYRNQLLGTVTVSLGVGSFPIHGAEGNDVLRATDNALYRSKSAGRDRVTVAVAA